MKKFTLTFVAMIAATTMMAQAEAIKAQNDTVVAQNDTVVAVADSVVAIADSVTALADSVAFVEPVTIQDICGNTYIVDSIGTQVWLAENFHCAKYDTESEAYKAGRLTVPTSSGSVYTPYYTDASKVSNWSDEARNRYGAYLTDEQVEHLGYLYNWAGALGLGTMDEARRVKPFEGHRQGICPNGWHVPTKAEWLTLADYIDGWKGKSNAGMKMRTVSGWYNNAQGTDEYGFSALPSGVAYGSSVNNLGEYAYFCTASPYEGLNYYAYSCFICSSNAYFTVRNSNRTYGLSVRCLKD